MFKIHSITGRIFVGVLVGLSVGVIINLFSSYFGLQMFGVLGFGVIVLFLMLGFTIGLVGIFDHHPIFGFKMRWWIRGIVAGFIFALIFILLAYDSAQQIMQSNLVVKIGFRSPFWMLLDGMMVGLLVAFLETKIAGEGSDLPLK